MWAAGDYPELVEDLITGLGPALVTASGVGPGERVLDVAAGSGNASIPAALAGARVVASDLTPELFDAGRKVAADAGVEIEWEQGDAEALPYDDAEFDTVLSASGSCSPRTTRRPPTSWCGSAAPAAPSACSAGRRRASSGRCSPP